MYIRKERVSEVQRHTSVLAVTFARRWLAQFQVVAGLQGQLRVMVLPWVGRVPSAVGIEFPACPPLSIQLCLILCNPLDHSSLSPAES